MKKTIAILSAIAALVACAKEAPIVEEPVQEENQEIKVNVTITCEGIDDTKAATGNALVKTDFADEDVVFIFFRGRTAPKYLEMKYSSSTDNWTATRKGGLLESDITDGTKQITAVYLPYGSDYSVFGSGGQFLLRKGDSSGPEYCGNFYTCGTGYSYEGETFTATIKLSGYKPTGSEVLVHYNVTGYTSGHQYYMAQDYLTPIYFDGINTDGVSVMKTVGHVGNRVTGYEDSVNGIISFSGIQDASAVNVEKNYRFVIHDKTVRDDADDYLSAYSRTDVGIKNINRSMYIGIGNISNATHWQHITQPYFSVSPTKLVEFAPGNLIKKKVGTYAFHANQYDITFKDQQAKFDEATAVADLLATENRDLFRWDEVAKYDPENTDAHVIGPGVTTGNAGTTYYTTVYESIDFGTIAGHNDWHLAPDFVYLLRYYPQPTGSFGCRGGSILACAVLTTENGFPDLYYMNGDRLGGTSGFFVFPDNWDDEWNTESINTRLNKTNTNYNVDSDDITMAKYSELIGHGAIFIPFNGIMNGANTRGEAHNGPRQVGNAGGSWSGSHIDPIDEQDRAIYPNLVGGGLTLSNPCRIFECRAVRLCRDLN